MPNFSVQFVSGAVLTAWDDPASATKPTRLNPRAGRWHSFWLHEPAPGGTPAQLKISAVVGGTVGPADSALGGKLFSWSWVETATGISVPIPTVASYSSKVEFVAGVFDSAAHYGHWCLLCMRESGGNVGVPFEVIP